MSDEEGSSSFDIVPLYGSSGYFSNDGGIGSGSWWTEESGDIGTRNFNLRILDKDSVSLFNAYENISGEDFDNINASGDESISFADLSGYLVIPGGGTSIGRFFNTNLSGYKQIRWFEIQVGDVSGADYNTFVDSISGLVEFDISGDTTPYSPVKIKLDYIDVLGGITFDTHISGVTDGGGEVPNEAPFFDNIDEYNPDTEIILFKGYGWGTDNGAFIKTNDDDPTFGSQYYPSSYTIADITNDISNNSSYYLGVSIHNSFEVVEEKSEINLTTLTPEDFEPKDRDYGGSDYGGSDYGGSDYGAELPEYIEGNICFLGEEKVETDQGKIKFEELDLSNTINGINIKKITKVTNSEDSIIFIHKHAFDKKMPLFYIFSPKNCHFFHVFSGEKLPHFLAKSGPTFGLRIGPGFGLKFGLTASVKSVFKSKKRHLLVVKPNYHELS